MLDMQVRWISSPCRENRVDYWSLQNGRINENFCPEFWPINYIYWPSQESEAGQSKERKSVQRSASWPQCSTLAPHWWLEQITEELKTFTLIKLPYSLSTIAPPPLFDIFQRFQSFLKLTHNSQVLGAAECVERFLHGDFTLVAARGGVAGDLEDQTVGPGQEVVVMAPWHHTGPSCSLPSEMTEGRFWNVHSGAHGPWSRH